MNLTRHQNWRFEQSLYPVRKSTTTHLDKKGNDVYGLFREDTGKMIAEVSDRYTLVHNRQLVEPFVKLFGTPHTTLLSGNHAHLYKFETGRDFDLGDGDIVKEQFIIRNSYNKSRSYEFMFGALRLVCTNGLYTGVSVFNFKKIHVGDIPVEEMIHEVIARYKENSFELWKKLKEVPLSLTQQLSMVSAWTPFEFKRPEGQTWNTPTEVKNDRIKSIARFLLEKPESLDNQRNGWGLFNQMNQATARELYSSAQTPRKVLGDKRAEEYLSKALEVSI